MQSTDPRLPPLRAVTSRPTPPDPRPPSPGTAEAARRKAALDGLDLMYAYYEAEPAAAAV